MITVTLDSKKVQAALQQLQKASADLQEGNLSWKSPKQPP